MLAFRSPAIARISSSPRSRRTTFPPSGSGSLVSRYHHSPMSAQSCSPRSAKASCLLIHEGQLTFADRGLQLWADMGEWWYRETKLPLPLGGNVVRRDLGDGLMRASGRGL